MNDRFYIALDGQVTNDEHAQTVEADLLLKVLPISFLEKTVEANVLKVLDPLADALNDAYGARHAEIALDVKDMIEQARADQNSSYTVSVLDCVRGGDLNFLDIGAKLGDYQECFTDKEVCLPNGTNVDTSMYIALMVRKNAGGGQ